MLARAIKGILNILPVRLVNPLLVTRASVAPVMFFVVPQPLCHYLQQVDPRPVHPHLPLVPGPSPDTATSALGPDWHSGQLVPFWAQQDSWSSISRTCDDRQDTSPTILFMVGSAPLVHSVPCMQRLSTFSINRNSPLNATFDYIEVEPEGVRPSYSPPPLCSWYSNPAPLFHL